MPIDEYEHSFDHLTESELPSLLANLKEDMGNERAMADFAIDGVGVATLCRNLELPSDFSGCYVLVENGKPIYVGISRSVLQRLRQHVRGSTHFDASLAYRIAAKRTPHKHTRSVAMEKEDFKMEFDWAKDYLRSLNVAYVRIPNPLVLYVFEPYCAMHFDTSEWNTFETH